MQTFKKILIFGIVNILLIMSMTYLFAQPSAVKVLLKEAKNESFNTLIIGQSHGETDIDPFVLSQSSDIEAFNLSRRLMPIENLYYLIKEANVNNNYKRIILDIGASYWMSDHSGLAGEDANLLFKLSGTRTLEYFWDVQWNDNYNDPLCDYLVTISSIMKIPQTIRAKTNALYWNSSPKAIEYANDAAGVSETYEYKGRGFRYGIKHSGIEHSKWEFDETQIKDENIKAFAKIVKYCREHDIDLICIQSATTPSRIKNENFDDVHRYFDELCSNYDVPFYDMNYVKTEYFQRSEEDFVDSDGHMMGALAEEHTNILLEIINSESPAIYFYETYEEVLNNLEVCEK